MKSASYDSYSPSGVEWLGEAPTHWRPIPVKYLALEQQSLFIDGDWIESKDLADAGIRYLTTGNVGKGIYKEQGMGFISDEKFNELNCTEVFPGDLLVSRLNRPIGRSCIVPELGHRIVTAVDNVIVRPDSHYSRSFLVYLFSSNDYFRHTDNLSRGATMQRISRGLLGNIRIVTPPLKEQTQIAKFLDYETARIDALIEKQQQLIALLKEKRQAVISHAVTKGLNPNAPMRDSGIEWLGKVPAHWGVSAIRHFADFYTGSTPDRSSAAFWGGDIPWVKTGEVKYEQIFDTEEKISKLGLDSSSCNVAPVGTILMALYGQGVTRGRVALLGVPAAFNQACVAINPNERLRSDFLHAFFLFAYSYIRDGHENTQMNMNVDLVKQIPVVLPPPEEQEAIVNKIDSTRARFDQLNDSASDLIAFLQERRTALISAAVTGKIDVRDWKAPNLHQEALGA